jgi:uncharacterized OB-fold protein
MATPDEALRALEPPLLSRDYDFFVEGLKNRELRMQKCSDCGLLRHAPMPMCPKCNSFEWKAQALSGKGRVYTYTVHHYPPIAPYQTPHPMVLVDMDEGVRLLAAFDGDPAKLRIGLPVEVDFVEIKGGFVLHRFRADGGRA